MVVQHTVMLFANYLSTVGSNSESENDDSLMKDNWQ